MKAYFIVISTIFITLTACTMSENNTPQNDHLPRIENPRFQLAVDLLDAGKVEELRTLLQEEPELLTHRAAEDGSRVGKYFAHPYLLWFIAENPTRNETLPENIVEVAEVIVSEAKRQQVEKLTDQLNYTLGLVASGRVPREEGKQEALIELLCQQGADPNSGMGGALAEGELASVHALLKQGARKSLPVLAMLGDIKAIRTLVPSNDMPAEPEMQKALMVAAIQGHANIIFRLSSEDYGKLDPNFYGPEGFHSHSTPLHQAAYHGQRKAVEEFLRQGARLDAKDKIWGGTARDWAEHGGHPDLAQFLVRAEQPAALVRAALDGDLKTLGNLLDQDPNAVDRWMPTYRGRLIHTICNLNFRRQNIGKTIRFLIERGANPNLGGKEDGSGESPLHIAASDGDPALGIEAIDALLDGGADINRLGGVITGGTPLHNATIFQLREIGAYLLERGAAYDLFLAAGNGRLDLIKPMFDEEGNLRADAPRVPGHNTDQSSQHRINWAFFSAAEAGDVEVLKFLHPKVSEYVTIPDGSTPLERAKYRKHQAAVDWLEKNGVR